MEHTQGRRAHPRESPSETQPSSRLPLRDVLTVRWCLAWESAPSRRHGALALPARSAPGGGPGAGHRPPPGTRVCRACAAGPRRQPGGRLRCSLRGLEDRRREGARPSLRLGTWPGARHPALHPVRTHPAPGRGSPHRCRERRSSGWRAGVYCRSAVLSTKEKVENCYREAINFLCYQECFT